MVFRAWGRIAVSVLRVREAAGLTLRPPCGTLLHTAGYWSRNADVTYRLVVQFTAISQHQCCWRAGRSFQERGNRCSQGAGLACSC